MTPASKSFKPEKKNGGGEAEEVEGKEAAGEGSPKQLFIVPSFNTRKEVQENHMKEPEEGTKLFFFPGLFGNLRSGVPFRPAWKGNPGTDYDSEDVYAKLGSCYSVSNLKYCTCELGLFNTDANTVWGARKCLLIFVGKKIYFDYLLYQRGVWGENGSIFF